MPPERVEQDSLLREINPGNEEARNVATYMIRTYAREGTAGIITLDCDMQLKLRNITEKLQQPDLTDEHRAMYEEIRDTVHRTQQACLPIITSGREIVVPAAPAGTVTGSPAFPYPSSPSGDSRGPSPQDPRSGS